LQVQDLLLPQDFWLPWLWLLDWLCNFGALQRANMPWPRQQQGCMHIYCGGGSTFFQQGRPPVYGALAGEALSVAEG
jgi:hypothetical protein